MSVLIISGCEIIGQVMDNQKFFLSDSKCPRSHHRVRPSLEDVLSTLRRWRLVFTE